MADLHMPENANMWTNQCYDRYIWNLKEKQLPANDVEHWYIFQCINSSPYYVQVNIFKFSSILQPVYSELQLWEWWHHSMFSWWNVSFIKSQNHFHVFFFAPGLLLLCQHFSPCHDSLLSKEWKTFHGLLVICRGMRNVLVHFLSMFRMCNKFIYLQGPLAWALIVWRCSLVFSSFDKLVSVLIHLLPGKWPKTWTPPFNSMYIIL
jgi:hypothetical protein